jgi:ligand-binding SRPBCC domain-containing protein
LKHILGVAKIPANQASLSVASRLAAPREEVWERVSTAAGVNDELMPIARMTLRSVDRLTPETVPLGERIERCWILLFGFLPIDWDDLTLVRVDPPAGFLERSTMLTMRLWEHERTLEELPGGGCLIRDRVRFEPRLPVPARVLLPVYRFVFTHRHRRLRRRFGLLRGGA